MSKKLLPVLMFLRKLVIVLAGSFIVGVSVNLFYVPAHLFGGGLTAIAIMCNDLFGWNIALLTLILNIPVLILGWFFVDREFMILSSLGMLGMTAGIHLSAELPPPSDNLFTCLICAGLVVGVGVGIILRQNASCGGVDVIGRILYKYYSISLGNTSLMLNILILGVGCYFFGLDVVAATIVLIFLIGRVINFIVEGINYKRTVIIISQRASQVADALMEEFGKGVTITDCIGAYSGEPKQQVMCAINPYQTPKLRNLVLSIDPRAFVTITESISVIGGGFKDKRLD